MKFKPGQYVAWRMNGNSGPAGDGIIKEAKSNGELTYYLIADAWVQEELIFSATPTVLLCRGAAEAETARKIIEATNGK